MRIDRVRLGWLAAALVACSSPPGPAPEPTAAESEVEAAERVRAPAREGLVLDGIPWDQRILVERAIAEADPRHAPTRVDGRPALASGGVSASFGDAAELRLRSSGREHTATLRAVSLGRGEARTALSAVAPTIDGPEVRAERAPGVVEWWSGGGPWRAGSSTA